MSLFVLGGLAIDYGPRRVSLGGRAVSLTPTEFDLIRVLSLNAGRVVTTTAVLRQVWGSRESGDADRVRTAIKRLRQKVGDHAPNPICIFNQHGVGYRMPEPGKA